MWIILPNRIVKIEKELHWDEDPEGAKWDLTIDAKTELVGLPEDLKVFCEERIVQGLVVGDEACNLVKALEEGEYVENSTEQDS
jgi:hypothetical protein